MPEKKPIGKRHMFYIPFNSKKDSAVSLITKRRRPLFSLNETNDKPPIRQPLGKPIRRIHLRGASL